jgi:hypothetical protein
LHAKENAFVDEHEAKNRNQCKLQWAWTCVECVLWQVETKTMQALTSKNTWRECSFWQLEIKGQWQWMRASICPCMNGASRSFKEHVFLNLTMK